MPDGWDDWLAQAQGASFAARAGFLDALPWALPTARMAILVARRQDRLVGAVPVSVTRRWGYRRAYSLPFGTYGGPIVDGLETEAGLVRAALAREFASWLEDQRMAGGEIVSAPPAGDGPDPAWSALASPVVESSTHVISLESGFDAYFSALRDKTREGMRRAVREQVVIREDPEALADAHALYLQQAEAWSGHRPYPLSFLRALLDHPSRFAQLHAGRRGKELLCAILSLSCGDERFIWWSAASPASRPTLAFPYLIVEIVRAAAMAGEKRVNLGSSGGLAALHKFKESVGARPRPLWIYRLAPRAGDWGLKLLLWARSLRRRR